MKYRQLGNTGVFVSELCMGAMTFGGTGVFEIIGALGQDAASALVHKALDAGINTFDTSPDAGGGRAESLLGESLRGRRQGVLLASRISALPGDATIEESVQASTRRLRSETIDIVHVSDTLFDTAEHCDQRLSELLRLRTQGRVGHIGLVVTNPVIALPLIESGYFNIVQMRCEIGKGGDGSRALDACLHRGLGISVAKSLASNVLRNIVDTLGPAWRGNKRARECCLKYLLGDRRVHMINVGMRWEHEVAQNAVLVSNLDAGTHPLIADSDGDGFLDGIEVLAGSDPNDAGSLPTGIAVPSLGLGGVFLLGGVLATLTWRRLRREAPL